MLKRLNVCVTYVVISLMNWLAKTGTTGDAKFHIASYLKQFFNNEIKNASSITNVDEAMYDMQTSIMQR